MVEQKKKFEQKKVVLEKYQDEIKILQGKICHITHYRNYGIENSIEHDKKIRKFKKEMKAWITDLKRDYGITNRVIPRQLSKYKSEIFRIDRQIDKLENQDKAQVFYPELRREETPRN